MIPQPGLISMAAWEHWAALTCLFQYPFETGNRPCRIETAYIRKKCSLLATLISTLSTSFAGMEGCADDYEVYDQVLSKDREYALPQGCYFLTNTNFAPNSPHLLVPYNDTPHRLGDFENGENGLTNFKELFNLRHARKRTVIRRTFDWFKKRFRTLNEARDGFSLDTQIKLVFALAAIHNFINEHEGHGSGSVDDYDSDGEAQLPPYEEDDDEGNEFPMPKRDNRMLAKRIEVAAAMWRDGLVEKR